MSSNHNHRNPHQVLDTQLAKKVLELEVTTYLYADKAMPKRFVSTLNRQLCTEISSARHYAIDALGLDSRLFLSDKILLLQKSQSAIRNFSILLNHLNDLKSVSNAAKAKFDEMIVNILQQQSKLVNSLLNKLSKKKSAQSNASDNQSETSVPVRYNCRIMSGAATTRHEDGSSDSGWNGDTDVDSFLMVTSHESE